MAAEASPTALNGNDSYRALVSQAMEDVLASESFCNSQQSQRLLRYLLEHTIAKHDDLLRERAIGVEVFGKQPGYDTNEDSIVRVRANELRKRLAKHYHSLEQSPAVRFSLPPGSYRLEIQDSPPPPAAAQIAETPLPQPRPEPAAVEPATTPTAAPRPDRRRFLLRAGAGLAICGAVAALGYRAIFPPGTVLDRFWAPAVDHPRPVVICIPHPVLYGLSRDFRTRATGARASHSQNLMEGLELDPNYPLQWKDIVTIRDQFVGVGTTHATAAVSAFFAERHKPSTIRFGNDVSFEDFKNSPTVLIAAFSNRWTLDMTAGWRFVFADADGVPVVRDRSTGRQWSLPSLQPNGRTEEDFAILSRVFQSQTGSFLVSAAGITQYGTRSAGEMLTNPVLLQKAIAGLGKDWPERNLQILIRMRIVGQVPAEPEVIATHQW